MNYRVRLAYICSCLWFIPFSYLNHKTQDCFSPVTWGPKRASSTVSAKGVVIILYEAGSSRKSSHCSPVFMNNFAQLLLAKCGKMADKKTTVSLPFLPDYCWLIKNYNMHGFYFTRIRKSQFSNLFFSKLLEKNYAHYTQIVL